eukprot:CAMPEP_0115084418 /NCGR_PEP_ID=MMETSP0227-20121206/21245_1 /TAXON_ID=89957 /ORGANISM="Polarella glacialis, Strain CCMP 1383" /LENGTH=109 /DNA_ID=CAMNT_0002473215 /DNA_START=137 /DNA_END=466 /DNA_ORIENTATION=-
MDFLLSVRASCTSTLESLFLGATPYPNCSARLLRRPALAALTAVTASRRLSLCGVPPTGKALMGSASLTSSFVASSFLSCGSAEMSAKASGLFARAASFSSSSLTLATG